MSRVLVTQEQLDEMVRRIVPPEYWPLALRGLSPTALPPNQTPVTNISVQAEEQFLKRIIKYYSVEELIKSIPRAYTLNWGVLYREAKMPGWDEYVRSSSIWINETALAVMGTLGMEFVLLHEVGHVDWNYRKEELLTCLKASDSEVYADFYAHEQLVRVYDRGLADTMLKQFASRHGAGKDAKNYDA